jgi:hypothetical protein
LQALLGQFLQRGGKQRRAAYWAERQIGAEADQHRLLIWPYFFTHWIKDTPA